MEEAFSESDLPYQVDVVDYNNVSAEFRAIIDGGNERIYAGRGGKAQNGWRKAKLGDVCDITSSKRIFACEYRPSGVPFFRGKEIIEKQSGKPITSKLFIDESRYDEIKNKHGAPKQGDLLLTSVGTLGVPYVVQDEHFYFKDGNLTWFRNFRHTSSQFVYYWLLSPFGKRQIDSKSIGSTQKALTIDALLGFEIDLPPLDEQCAIANTLSSLDNKIANNRAINHHLEQMAQAIFKSWFVDFEPWGGVMPDDWREGTLSDLGDVVGGSTPSKAKPEYYTECGIAWITPKDLSINKNKFIARGADDITELGLRNSSARLMPKGTVLFSSRAPIGYIAIASGEVCTNQGFKSVIPKRNVSTAFVYYFLKENLEIIEGMASGSTFKEVSGAVMKVIPAVIPDDNTLCRFQADCAPIFDKQALLEGENANLAALRDALLPRLMSGEINIKEVQR